MHLTERTVEQDQDHGRAPADGQMCKRRGDGREQRNRRATGVSNLKTRVGVREVRGYHAQIPVVGAH